MKRCIALLVTLTLFVISSLACQSTPTPAPIPTANVSRAAGSGPTQAVRVMMWNTAIATTTTQTSDSLDAGPYGTVQAWLTVDVASAQLITPTVQMSPDDTNWLSIYSFGGISADQIYTYTTLTDAGKWLRVSFAMTGTATVTPTMQFVLKD